jgi:hypothetical protein
LKLNDFSQVFADSLFARHPEWRAHAGTYGEADDCLVLKVPAPERSQAEGPLLIHADAEVTVGFDFHHCHFNWPPDFGETDRNINALSFIDALLTEEIGVVTWWRQETMSLSTTFTADESDRLEPPPGATRVRRRSWNGTLNADIAL